MIGQVVRSNEEGPGSAPGLSCVPHLHLDDRNNDTVHASGLDPKDAAIRSWAMRLLSGGSFPRGTGFDFRWRSGGESDPAWWIWPRGQRVWGFLDGVLGGAAAGRSPTTRLRSP